ncbi:SDR family NAD(P)-dependent oxidoreductase [Streptomyces sp. NPDC020965]|uniref:SDR family NAD(P)-dependent oxidoreductase n=1 Tax=Streptomyces sp. NPDC020965 TaxID=3365105 RepID=UPI0037A06273
MGSQRLRPVSLRRAAMTETGDHPLTGRTVLVAGATGGIGEGMTRSLLRQGATVVATGRNASTLEQLADYTRDLGPGVLFTRQLNVGARTPKPYAGQWPSTASSTAWS